VKATPWYRPLLAPVALIAAIGIAAKLLQAGGGILLAHRFGADHATDAYVLAKSLPIGVYLVFDSLLYNSVVPVYHGPRRTAEAWRAFLGAWTVLCTGAAVGISVVLALAAGPICAVLAPGGDPETLGLAAGLCRLMSLAVLTALPASFLKALNASRQRYVLASLDGFVMSGALVLALAAPPARWGIWPVAAALPVSCAALFIIQLFAARRDARPARPAWRSPLLAEMAWLMAPLVAFNCLHQVNVLAMNAFMASVGPGAISCLNYSYNIAQIPVSVIDLVLLSTLFPFAAALFSEQDMGTFATAYRSVARLLVLVLAPASVWLILERHALVQLVFEHGRFDTQATAGTASCLVGVGLAVTPWAFETFAYRCLFALKRHGEYARIVAVRVALNVALCAAVVPWLGHLGLGLSFAASFFVGAWLSARAVARAAGPDAPGPWAVGPMAMAAVSGLGVWAACSAVEQLCAAGFPAPPGIARLAMSGLAGVGIVMLTHAAVRRARRVRKA